MRARLAVPAAVAAVAVLGTGCVTQGRELRAQAEQHAPVVPRHEVRRLGPATGLMLVNPLVCFEGGSSCSGGGEGAGLCALVLIACAGVLGAVDVVALPIQAVRRHGQVKDLERIGLACPVDDPAARAASGLADRMVKEFGFAPAPAAGPGTVTVGATGELTVAPAAPAPLEVRVRTTRFERASRVEWQAAVDFLGPRRKLLLSRACAGRAPDRDARTFVEECEAAREELEALADQCVEEVTSDLRKHWKDWEPAKTPPTEEPAPEGQVGIYDPWGGH